MDWIQKMIENLFTPLIIIFSGPVVFVCSIIRLFSVILCGASSVSLIIKRTHPPNRLVKTRPVDVFKELKFI